MGKKGLNESIMLTDKEFKKLKSLVEEVQNPERNQEDKKAKKKKKKGLSEMHAEAKEILPNFWGTAALVVKYHEEQKE